jgi:hypothetical protein
VFMLGEVWVNVAVLMFVFVFVVMSMRLRGQLDHQAVRRRQVVVQPGRRAPGHLGHGLERDAQHQQRHTGALRCAAQGGRRNPVHSATSSKRVYSAWCQESSARTLRVALAPGAMEKRHSRATSPSSPSR